MTKRVEDLTPERHAEILARRRERGLTEAQKERKRDLERERNKRRVLTPEQRERKRERDRLRDAGRRVTGKVNSTYRLSPRERREISTLVALSLWSQEAIARAFQVSRKTVTTCHEQYKPLGVS